MGIETQSFLLTLFSSFVIFVGFMLATVVMMRYIATLIKKKSTIKKLKKIEDIEILTFDKNGIPVLIKDKNSTRFL